MKKILIVSGDSFSDKHFQTMIHPELDTSWPKWPEMLAEKLDMDCINLGRCGAGNDYIYETLVDTIQSVDKDRIGLVIAAWSQSQRRSWQESKRLVWKNSRVDTKGDVFYWVKRTMRYWYSFQVLCERYNLPYKQFQMISLFEGWLNGLFKDVYELRKNCFGESYLIEKHIYPGNKDIDMIILSKMVLDYEKNINDKNFIGWPYVKSLGGYHVEQLLFRKMNGLAIEGMTISKDDVHPTAKGQEKIMEFIYGQLA